VYIGSIGIFFSTLFKRTTAATVATYGILILVSLGTVLLLWGVTSLLGLRADLLLPDDAVRPNPNLGNFVLLLLVNPGVTCFSMIESQTGTGSGLSDFLGRFGTLSLSIQNSWFLLSITLQLLLSVLLVWLSAKQLNPLKQGRKKHKKNK
jgi:hypothetical protein